MAKPAVRLLYESHSGYCCIYYCERGGRKFAYKTLRPEFAENPVYRELLQKEYEIGSRLYHHNIVNVFSLEDIEGLGPTIVMEYIDGIRLSDYLSGIKPRAHDADKIIGQLTEALAYVHRHGLVHRDIKPTNILISASDGNLKIIDFGLSDGSAFTRFKTGGGTQDYTAPEQLRECVESDPRVDVYSVGRIMLDFPRRDIAWQRVAIKCASENPADRPATVDEIMPAVRKLSRRLKFALAAILSLIAIGLVIPFLAIPLLQKPQPTHVTEIPINRSDTLMGAEAVMEQPLVSDSVKDISTPLSGVSMKPEQMPQQTPDLSETTSILPLEEEAYRKLNEIAARYWRGHINTIDTMRNIATIRLATVGYWRHLSKTEFKSWLEQRVSIDSPYFNQMMQMADQTVRKYEKDHLFEEGKAWVRAHDRKVVKATLEFTQEIKPDVYEHRVFLENGTWSIHSWNEAVRRELAGEQEKDRFRRENPDADFDEFTP